jgi:protein arginine kinase
VLSSRVRLIRNVAGVVFPAALAPASAVEVRERLRIALEGLGQAPHHFQCEGMAEGAKEFFRERRMAGRTFVDLGVGGGITVLGDPAVQLRFNDVDHLKISSLRPGVALREAYAAVDGLDSALSRRVAFAYDSTRGYLTADPANLGTGLRASLLVFLPALTAADRMGALYTIAQQIGCSLIGGMGNGAQASGCLFQLQNQVTLGDDEETILRQVEKFGELAQLREQLTQEDLGKKFPQQMKDHCLQAMVLLRSAYRIAAPDALNLLAQVRLGAFFDFFPTGTARRVDRLMMEVQPANLQVSHGNWLSEEKENTLRAELIRNALAAEGAPC